MAFYAMGPVAADVLTVQAIVDKRSLALAKAEAAAGWTVLPVPDALRLNVDPAMPEDGYAGGAALALLGREVAVVGGVLADAARPVATRSAKYRAAIGLHNGLLRFRDYVEAHAPGVPQAAVGRVLDYLYQAHRAAHMIVTGTATNAAKPETDAQVIAWCNAMRLGPADSSVITEVGVYDVDGLFQIFEKAAGHTDPAGASSWVDLDTSNWTADGEGNANAVPVRVNVDAIQVVNGPVTAYLNVQSLEWLTDI